LTTEINEAATSVRFRLDSGVFVLPLYVDRYVWVVDGLYGIRIVVEPSGFHVFWLLAVVVRAGQRSPGAGECEALVLTRSPGAGAVRQTNLNASSSARLRRPAGVITASLPR
jgi:hypothetical protein